MKLGELRSGGGHSENRHVCSKSTKKPSRPKLYLKVAQSCSDLDTVLSGSRNKPRRKVSKQLPQIHLLKGHLHTCATVDEHLELLRNLPHRKTATAELDNGNKLMSCQPLNVEPNQKPPGATLHCQRPLPDENREEEVAT